VHAIHELEETARRARTGGEQLADVIVSAAGSSWFIAFHVVWFALWVIVNVGLVGVTPFDPFPFSFLTVVVSLEAIFLALLVLASQNRLTRQAERRAHIDLQVNLLAEQESTLTLVLVRDIARRLGIEPPAACNDLALAADTDVRSVASEVDARLQIDPTGSTPSR
jgi:uncharacterized membrane protein